MSHSLDTLPRDLLRHELVRDATHRAMLCCVNKALVALLRPQPEDIVQKRRPPRAWPHLWPGQALRAALRDDHVTRVRQLLRPRGRVTLRFHELRWAVRGGAMSVLEAFCARTPEMQSLVLAMAVHAGQWAIMETWAPPPRTESRHLRLFPYALTERRVASYGPLPGLPGIQHGDYYVAVIHALLQRGNLHLLQWLDARYTPKSHSVRLSCMLDADVAAASSQWRATLPWLLQDLDAGDMDTVECGFGISGATWFRMLTAGLVLLCGAIKRGQWDLARWILANEKYKATWFKDHMFHIVDPAARCLVRHPERAAGMPADWRAASEVWGLDARDCTAMLAQRGHLTELQRRRAAVTPTNPEAWMLEAARAAVWHDQPAVLAWLEELDAPGLLAAMQHLGARRPNPDRGLHPARRHAYPAGPVRARFVAAVTRCWRWLAVRGHCGYTLLARQNVPHAALALPWQ